MLLHEVNHRVANSLALVAALVGMQARASSEPSVRAALSEVQTRILAIAGVHRRRLHVCRTSARWRNLGLSARACCTISRRRSREAGHASTVRLTADAIQLPTDKAVSIRRHRHRARHQCVQVCISGRDRRRNPRAVSRLRRQGQPRGRGRRHRLDRRRRPAGLLVSAAASSSALVRGLRRHTEPTPRPAAAAASQPRIRGVRTLLRIPADCHGWHSSGPAGKTLAERGQATERLTRTKPGQHSPTRREATPEFDRGAHICSTARTRTAAAPVRSALRGE